MYPFGKRRRRVKKQVLQLGNRQVLMDKKLIEKQNNMALNQCKENDEAFLRYKVQKLFPKKKEQRRTLDEQKRGKKAFVRAFKVLQDSVKMRTVLDADSWFGYVAPPLSYTKFNQIVEQK